MITTQANERKNGGAPYVSTDVRVNGVLVGLVNRDKRPYAKCRALTMDGRREEFTKMADAIAFLTKGH